MTEDNDYQKFTFQHFDRFRGKISFHDMIKETFNCDELYIMFISGSPFYELSSIYPLTVRIKHNCKFINNDCPTLEQYYQQFKVLKRDIKPNNE